VVKTGTFSSIEPEESAWIARMDRMKEGLLNAIQVKAKDEGVPYQRFIRMALERAVQLRR